MTFNINRRTSLRYLLLDIATLVVVFNLVIYLRISSTEPLFLPLVAPAAIFIVAIHLIDGYGSRSDMLSLDYTSLHLIACVFAALATLFLTFAVVPSGFELRSSRGAILGSFAIVAAITLGYRRYLYYRTVASLSLRKLIFFGSNADFENFEAECRRLKLDKPLIKASASDSYSTLAELIANDGSNETQVEAIVIKESASELSGDLPIQLVRLYFAGIPTYTLEIFHQVYWRKIPLYRINPVWLFQEGFQIAREPVFERLKRISDIAFAAAGLLFSAPFIGLAAVAIKIEDGGPVFFRQTRVGKNQQRFQLLKLRTMRTALPNDDLYTKPGDSRITRTGKFLRSARLDELPQLWNVLRGDMSLIGPRAEWDVLVEKYEREIACYHFRHLVKPGITGWAQVNYRYGMGTEDTLRKLEYDLYYIRNYSFMLDASIVLKTLHVMLFQKGH